ncbi:MAG: AMP-binding protein, partial [Acidimicrobiales bacterium]
MPTPLLPSVAGVFGDGPDAVVVAGRRMSWSDLAGAAGAVARRVGGAGVVAVEAGASLETVAAVVGCLMAGVPAVPLAPDAGPMEREHVLRDCGAELVLGSSEGAVAVDLAETGDPPGMEPGPEEPALIIYTSGTTGPPKGVVTLRGSIAANVDAVAEAWDWTGADVLVQGLPLFHIHGLILGLLGPLRMGCRLVHTGRPTSDAYAAAAEEEGGTLF